MTTPRTDQPPDSAPSPRWRILLAIAVVIVTGLLLLAAAQFPPRPPVTGGGGPPCPSCFSFSVVAGIGGGLTFNGTVPGPSITVPLGAQVTVQLVVSAAASGPHSWMLVPRNGTSSSAVVFPGANTTDPTLGTKPGSSAVATFTATAAGSYKYISGVDADDRAMWGYFNVTA